MRLLATSSLLLAGALLVACPSNRQAGGDGGGGGGGASGDVCDLDGVEVGVPDEVASNDDGAAPDLSCIGSPVQVEAPHNLTLEGCVDIFGTGSRASSGTEVAVFSADSDPHDGTPIATTTIALVDDSTELRGTCSRSGTPCGPTERCVVDANAGRDDGFCDCRTGPDADAPACRAYECSSEGFYRFEGSIPSNTPVTMRITNPTDDTVVDTYIWGLVPVDALAVDDVFTYNAALIYASTYQSISVLAGKAPDGYRDLTDGQGNGAIAGEIHDCSDTIVGGAVVGLDDFDRFTMAITYFDGAADPHPDTRRTSTASDGLYAIMNVPTDVEHTVVAGVRDPACTGDDCSCLSLGSRKVRAYPDSVSIVTLRGDFPAHP